MTITDLKGMEIEVTVLQLAIMQADDYRHYRHQDKGFEKMDTELAAYWQDMYNKLTALQTGQGGTPSATLPAIAGKTCCGQSGSPISSQAVR